MNHKLYTSIDDNRHLLNSGNLNSMSLVEEKKMKFIKNSYYGSYDSDIHDGLQNALNKALCKHGNQDEELFFFIKSKNIESKSAYYAYDIDYFFEMVVDVAIYKTTKTILLENLKKIDNKKFAFRNKKELLKNESIYEYVEKNLAFIKYNINHIKREDINVMDIYEEFEKNIYMYLKTSNKDVLNFIEEVSLKFDEINYMFNDFKDIDIVDFYYHLSDNIIEFINEKSEKISNKKKPKESLTKNDLKKISEVKSLLF